MNLPVEVVEAVATGRCVAFWGSAGTREAVERAGLPWTDGPALARELGWKKPKAALGGKARAATPSVEEGAAAWEAAHGRPALVAKLRDAVGAVGVPPAPAHAALLRRFALVLTTCWDNVIERAGTVEVLGRQDALPEPDPSRRVLMRLRGGFERPEGPVVTAADYAARPLHPETRKRLRTLLRARVVLFIGFRPDEEEFERLWAELSDVYGGELPRCHLAVPQGPIDDLLWQRWVWRGLLMFTADPGECLDAIEAAA